ncbi:MAG: hypothetical protein ACLTCP_04870 [Ruminococcus bicirculans (ex Wegman et al. 2014)]
MLSVKNRIIKTSRRDFRVNKLLFIITNLVLFMNFIMQMSMRKFITYYSSQQQTIMRVLTLHTLAMRR